MEAFSVLLSLYSKEDSGFLKDCLASVFSQSLPPDEVILVEDGPITAELDSVVKEFAEKYPGILRVIPFPKNRGLGPALSDGVLACSNNIIIRMDTDDICVADRFKKQIEYFQSNPSTDILGGQIAEFIDHVDNNVGRREVPLSHAEIMKFLKQRCPFNHMTVAFRKPSVIKNGNYRPWHYNEDYYLWIRMAEGGCRFANLPDTLVNVRVGADMYRRRGGWRYFKSEKGLQDYMLKHKIISLPRYLYNVAGRFAVQVAMPNRLRGFIFQKLFRK